MIPQMLSSPSPATGRTAPPQPDTARESRTRDADAASFTLAAEDKTADAQGSSDLQLSLPFDPGSARPSGTAVSREMPSVAAGPAPVQRSDAALRDGGTTPVAPGPPTVPHGAATTETIDSAQQQPVRSQAEDTLRNTAATPVSQDRTPGAAATDPAVLRPDARNAATAVPTTALPVAGTRTLDPNRLDHPPPMRGAALSPGGDAPTTAGPPVDGPPADGASANGGALDPARTSGPGTPPSATASADTVMVSAERGTPSADAVATPQETDVTRADSGRADALRTEPVRADLARTAGSQLVEAVRHGPGGSTDVALNPEELGRVRLSLMTQDGVLHVTVLAERPETHDLLRRNIGLLQSDFRALGYTDVAFDFGQGGDRSDRPDRPADTAPISTDAPPGTIAEVTDAPAADQKPAAASARLDLRL